MFITMFNRNKTKPIPTGGRCSACANFCNDPAYLERVIPGLSSMSSAHASVRADDGLCSRHDRYLSARSSCADFVPHGTNP